MATTIDWQPIDSAPRHHEALVLLYAPLKDFDGQVWKIWPGYWDQKVEHWRMFGLIVYPTHWVPFPDAPTGSSSLTQEAQYE